MAVSTQTLEELEDTARDRSDAIEELPRENNELQEKVA